MISASILRGFIVGESGYSRVFPLKGELHVLDMLREVGKKKTSNQVEKPALNA